MYQGSGRRERNHQHKEGKKAQEGGCAAGLTVSQSRLAASQKAGVINKIPNELEYFERVMQLGKICGINMYIENKEIGKKTI